MNEEIREVVVNRCYGGFGLSVLAEIEIAKRKGIEITFTSGWGKESKLLTHEEALSVKRAMFLFSDMDEPARDDPDMVAVVKALGNDANGWAAELEVVEIPDDVEWRIDDYDGVETIHEKHRSW